MKPTASAFTSRRSPEPGVRSPELGLDALRAAIVGSGPRIIRLGSMAWAQALEWQREVQRARIDGACGDTLLLVEHPPTYTTGSSYLPEHLIASPAQLAAEGAVLVEADRGGSITYHGPGQLVGYPIVDLTARGRDLHKYMRDLEQVLISVLAGWGIEGLREQGKTGVFAGGGKVASIGVRVSRWVTMHGFALNICTDVKAFERIVPCGLVGCVATTVHGLSSARPGVWDAAAPVRDAFAQVMGIDFRE